MGFLEDMQDMRFVRIYIFICLIGQQTQDYTPSTHQIHNKRST